MDKPLLVANSRSLNEPIDINQYVSIFRENHVNLPKT